MQQLINDILHDMSEVLSAKELYALQICITKEIKYNKIKHIHILILSIWICLFLLKELKVVQSEL